MNKFKYLLFCLSLSWVGVSHGAYVIRPLAISGGSLSNVSINSDINLSFNLNATRNGVGQPVCENAPVTGAIFYMVYWLEDVTIAGEKVNITSVPSWFNEAHYNRVVASKINGNTVTVVGRRDDYNMIPPGQCIGASSSAMSLTSGEMKLSNVLGAGSHRIQLTFRAMRILGSADLTPTYILNLAERYKSLSHPQTITGYVNIASYCTGVTNGPVELNYGTVNLSEVNNRSVSKTISFQCNSQTSLPKITLSRNQIKICDGINMNISYRVNKGSGFNVNTTFESILRMNGEVGSSCAKSFSENVVATITPP